MIAPLKRLEDLRAQIASLQAERDHVEKAPRPLAEFSQGLASWLDTIAAKFQPDVRRALNPGEEFGLAAVSLFGRGPHGQVSELEVTAALAALCRRDLERLLLDRARAEHEKRPAGLPSAQRAKKLAELGRELVKLERAEEKLVRELEHSGVDVDRRADADPAVVLSRDEELAA